MSGSVVIIALVVVAALLGLLGNGPLSASVKTGVSLEVEYDRFLHRNAPSSYRIHLKPRGTETAIHLGREFLESVKLDQIVPQPGEVELANDGILLHFRSKREPRRDLDTINQEASAFRFAGALGFATLAGPGR